MLEKNAVDTTYHGLLVCPQDRMTTLQLVPKTAPSHLRDYCFGLGKNFEGRATPSDVACAWRERAGDGFEESLKSLFGGTPLTCKNANVSAFLRDGKLESLDFDMRLQAKGCGDRAGTMARSFEFTHPDGPTVYHSYFSLAPEFQDAGIAKRILGNSLELYDRLGIERVSLTAGLEVGGYAWARYGFKPESKESLRELQDEVRWNLDQLGVSTRTHSLVSRLLDSDDPKSVWTLSDLDMMVTGYDGGRMKLGKALLMGTAWDGELDLKDDESRERFQQYVSHAQ